MRSTISPQSVRRFCGTMVQTSARLLALLSLLQVRREWTGQELADRLEVGPARSAATSTSCARSAIRSRPRPGSPAATGSAPAASCRRCCSTTPRRSRSPSACGRRPPARSPGSRRPRSARWPSSSRCCPRGCAGGSARSATPPRRSASRARGSTPTCWRRSPAPAATGRGCASPTSPATSSASQRNTEPTAVVYSGYRWYLVAFDLDRDDWRTFRIDRIRGRLRPGERGRRRTVPGGDPAAYVKGRLRRVRDGEAVAPPGRVRLAAPAAGVRGRIPAATRRRARRRGRVHRHHPGRLVVQLPGLDGDARRADRGARPARAGGGGAGARGAVGAAA